jgi:ribonuclease HI
MGFYTIEEAKYAINRPYEELKNSGKTKKQLTPAEKKVFGEPIGKAIAVDAAFNTKTKMLEYQGVLVETSSLFFHFGPIKGGSNNIGEFLAIVHALALMQKHKFSYPLYSDSVTAISWVRKKHCNTQISNNQDNTKILELVKRAEIWLKNNDFSNIKIMKWQTEAWGEIPADFGRK